MACRDSYNSSLWDGRDEANNFRREFKSFLESVNEEELRKKLGNHSERKGNNILFILLFVYTLRDVYDLIYRCEHLLMLSK